ncbi:MAG: hypothetical protein PHQ27_02920 [Victivallales bacterium]|nr:hypothetical protein [Victivallales bacterium]
MRKLSFAFLACLILNGCCLLISKPVFEEVEFKNLTGNGIKIIYTDSDNIIPLSNEEIGTLKLEKSRLIKVYFSDSNNTFEYDLSNLYDIAVIDDSKSGPCFWGHIHLVYPCKVTKNKTLIFYEGIDVSIIYPVDSKKERIILYKKPPPPEKDVKETKIFFPED